MQLAENDSEVLSWVTGAYLPLDENFDDSIVLIDRSIALNPGSSLAWLMSGWLRAAAGDADRAVEHFQMSMRLDPCSSDRGYQLSGIALARFGQGRYAEAAALLKESLQLQPTVSINQALLAACYGHLGEVDAARAAIASYQALSSRQLQERVTPVPQAGASQGVPGGDRSRRSGRLEPVCEPRHKPGRRYRTPITDGWMWNEARCQKSTGATADGRSGAEECVARAPDEQ